MDCFESIKFSNFTSNSKTGTFNRLTSEVCSDSTTRAEAESTKPMKYYTSDFWKNSSERDSLTKGINFSDGFGVNISDIDKSTKFRIGHVSDRRFLGDLPSLPLPTTASFVSGQGNTDIEDKHVRPGSGRVLKACNVKDTEYYNRSFAVFSSEIPSPISVPETQRGGISTKGTISKKYTRGAGC